MNKLLLCTMSLMIISIVSCTKGPVGSSQDDTIDSTRALKEYYQEYFAIGVSVSPRALASDEAELIKTQFNSLTCENVMKMGPIHPAIDSFNWEPADKVVAFAQANGMKMRGHTLCWHNQAPPWLFVNEKGDTVSKEVLLDRLKNHIQQVVGRYKGKIYAWDVVNEAISDRPDEFYRKSAWYKICGEEFIERAFQFAHEADPEALLFYNDYNEISDTKRQKIMKLVSQLKEKGVPIHGVGLQGHWAINEPSAAQLENTLSDFESLGLTLQITEMDISVYPKEHNRRDQTGADTDTAFTQEKERAQIEMYKMCFELFRMHKESISGVTFWNVSDRHSWLDNFPVRNRKDYPLLFDEDLKPKKAFWEVVNF